MPRPHRPGAQPRSFLLWHAGVPAVAFLAVAAVAAFTDADRLLEHLWAYDELHHAFLGTGAGEWWARTLVHEVGGALVRLAAVVAIALWVLAGRRPRLARWRPVLGYVLVAALASTAIVGVLKASTNVDCPRTLDEFGGTRPYVHLLGDRPDGLPRARCFPGGHSSSGFALFALYFGLRNTSRRLARRSLVLACAVGGLFAFAQEARGAHFLSHDAWSAAIAWFTCLACYLAWRRRPAQNVQLSPNCSTG